MSGVCWGVEGCGDCTGVAGSGVCGDGTPSPAPEVVGGTLGEVGDGAVGAVGACGGGVGGVGEASNLVTSLLICLSMSSTFWLSLVATGGASFV